MSNMRNGFSTLNRWLGKKNKEKSPAPNGKLSKSNANLSISTTNISDTSQLEYNRIAPLPAITSNAPFEQTFRITVLLPKDQLYVARLGARVPLKKLLELACDHKSLDPEKYEFRSPVDPSQVYSCDLTIGAVGLSEIRLCHKTDPYDSFNSEEVMKLHRTSVIRDSLSSSEFSSRNSKHTTKTASPYSSSNSLNSMDSTGMNYTRTLISPPPALPKSMPPKMTAPPRKKRAAPRPPSQIVIPEKAALVIEQEAAQTEQNIEAMKQQQDTTSIRTRKEYFASTPNLYSNVNANGNNSTENKIEISSSRGPSETIITNGNVIECNDSEYAQVVKKNARNVHGGSALNLSNDRHSTDCSKVPEPSPRKPIVLIKKKAAPAPPPRTSSIDVGEDARSIASSIISTPETPNTVELEHFLEIKNQTDSIEKQEPTRPTPLARESTPTKQQQSSTLVYEAEAPTSVPKPVPRQTTATFLNATPESPRIVAQNTNVSKVLLNRSPTPEPRSLTSDSSETVEALSSLPGTISNVNDNDDNVSKQADSGIGELVPSPLPDSLPSEGSAPECKSNFESSSDDDEIIKTYNFKLCKTTVNNIDIEQSAPQSIEELQALREDHEELTPAPLTLEGTPNLGSPSSWNFAIPISPPPNFADGTTTEAERTPTDAPITPKIMERPVLNFENFSAAETSKDVVDDSAKIPTPIEKRSRTPLESPGSAINEIIDELSTILNENRMDTLIKRHEDRSEIQSAKPNTLSNFKISTLETQLINVMVESPVINDTSLPNIIPSTVCGKETLCKERGSSENGISQLKAVARADSFHMTSTVNGSPNCAKDESSNGLQSRSSSYLSLSKVDQNSGLNQRRSSSELSIAESPFLQSLEVIKTILNSRKNSLANSSDGESKTQIRNRKNKESRTSLDAPNTGSPQSREISKISTAETTETIIPTEKSKVYRYSGPPSINFSTWSERPKAQVAIKNEGDYIFGGKNAGTQSSAVTHADVELRTQNVPRQQRTTMYVMNSDVKKFYPPTIAPKPTTTTERMGIPEKEYHVPLTVKPLKDVRIERPKVEQRTSKSMEPNISKTMLNSEASLINKGVSNPSTLPRHSTNRFSIPVKTSAISLLRSTSITQLEQINSSQTNTSSGAAPFGQNTLRRTGLKDKMLEKENHAQDKQNDVITSTKSTPYVSDSAVLRTNLKKSTFHINNNGLPTKPISTFKSAKLELKLEEPSQMFIKQNGTTTPPAPVPPMLNLKSITLRSKSTTPAITPTPKNADQRDALLEAIRNFKRAELNRI